MSSLLNFVSKRLFIYMILILAGLCTISVLLFAMSEAEKKKLQSIQKERSIINEATSLLFYADEMAMSGRGYYIVREKRFLDEFVLTRSKLLAQSSLFTRYANINIIPPSTAKHIMEVVNKRIAVSDSIVSLVNRNEQSTLKIRYYLKLGTDHTTTIRNIVQQFTNERMLLVNKMEQDTVDATQTFRVLFTINIISLTLVVVVGFGYVYKSFRAKAKAEKILSSYRQSNQFLNSLSEGLIMQNRKGYILECNTAAERILGFSKDQLLDRTSLDPQWKAIYEDGTPFPGEKHPPMQVLETGKSHENVIMGIFKKSGQLSWLRINAHPVWADDGTVSSVVTTFTDITEEKIARQKLEQNEERLHLALEKTGENAWEHNFETGVTWFSAANNHFLGYTTDELNESENEDKWWDNTHADDKHMLIQNDEEYRSGVRSNHSMEYRIYHKDGSMKWVLDRGIVIERFPDGKPLRIVGTHTDVSKEKMLQQQLAFQEQRKKKEIVEAVIQAQERERHEIAYELHENINQALSSGKMMLDFVSTGDERTNSYLAQIKKNIGEAIDEMRKISQSINPKSLELVGLSAAVNDLLTSFNNERNLNISYHTDAFNESVVYNKNAELTVFRIVQEQMLNIVRHSNATEVTIDLSGDEEHLSLSITDNGIGADFSVINKGLGFTNMKNRAEHYNGQLTIESAPGKGCKLELYIPA